MKVVKVVFVVFLIGGATSNAHAQLPLVGDVPKAISSTPAVPVLTPNIGSAPSVEPATAGEATNGIPSPNGVPTTNGIPSPNGVPTTEGVPSPDGVPIPGSLDGTGGTQPTGPPSLGKAPGDGGPGLGTGLGTNTGPGSGSGSGGGRSGPGSDGERSHGDSHGELQPGETSGSTGRSHGTLHDGVHRQNDNSVLRASVKAQRNRQPIGSAIPVLAIHMMALSKPLAIPLALAVAIGMFLLIALRRPRKLAKIDGDAWGGDRDVWRL